MAVKKKKRMSVGASIFLVFFLAAAVVGIYFLIMNKNKPEKLEVPVEQTEVDILLDKNIEGEYPPTVREVVKTYCRLVKCLYNDEMTADETEILIKKLRLLYDDMLLEQENNKEENHIAALTGDIAHYRANNITINSYSIDRSGKIVYSDSDKGELAVINMYFTLKENTVFNRVYEEFKLHKDDAGHWKIYKFSQVDMSEIEDED